MADVIDELVVTLGLDHKNFSSGEKAVIAGLDKIAGFMEQLISTFDDGEKKTGETLKKISDNADKTGKNMAASGKRAAEFFSGIRKEVLALAGVTLSLGGIQRFVTGFTGKLTELSTAATAFGLSAKSLDGWIKAGKAFGVSANEINGAFSKISDARAKLAAGYGLDDTLQTVMQFSSFTGANIDVFNDSTEEIQKKIAANFTRLTEPQQRHLGQALGWGYSGQQWLASGHALNDVGRFTASSGVTREAESAALRFQEQWARISQQMEKTGYILFNNLLPYVEKFNLLLMDFSEWLNKNPEKIGVFVDQLLEMSGVINDAAEAVGGWKNAIIILIGASVGGKFLTLLTGIGGALSGPGGLIAGLIALEKLVIEPLESRYPLLKNNIISDTLNKPPGTDFIERAGKATRGWIKGLFGITEQAKSPTITEPPKPTAAGKKLLERLQPKLTELENKHGLPTGLLRSVAIAESAGNPRAVSGAKAKGLFQFMDGTARDMGLTGDDVFDPEKSASAAAKYLAQLMRMFGNVPDALAAYNWGPGNMKRLGMGAAPRETRDYIPRVMSNLPIPGAGMLSEPNNRSGGKTINESININTLQVNSPANAIPGIVNDARERVRLSGLANAYASGMQ